MPVADRFRSERDRLDLTATAVAERCGVTRMTVHRWEGGTPVPSDALEVLSGLGFDVQFVLTGKRAKGSGVEAPDAVLSGDEWELVKRYRALNESTQAHAREVVKALGKSAPAEGTQVKVRGSRNIVAGGDVNMGSRKR